jgi:parvulin-like peptidyl-prolyl isomerase
VNGQPITMIGFENRVNQDIEGRRALGAPLPADPNAIRANILDQMIDELLIQQAAAIQNVKVSDAEIDTEIQQEITLAGGQAKWEAWLSLNHLTPADSRDVVRKVLVTNKMRDIVTAGVGNTAEQVHARHILVSTEATANEVLAKLKAGTDFATLAAQYSQDTSTRDTGGDLGWFAKGELLEPAVEDAAFAIQTPNQISGPVKSNLGYHIIQMLERVKDRPISPETHYKLAKKAFEAWQQSLEKNAKIERYPNGHSG